MPKTKKGKKIMKAMTKTYGKKKAVQVYHATKNAKQITGVEKNAG